VALTPAIRGFLVRLDELLETHDLSLQPDVTAIDTAAFLRLGDVEMEVDDHVVLVRYRPEEIKFTSRDEALQFIQMIADGRVELEVQRSLLWTTMRSYRDGQPIPFRRTRMPWPTLHPRTERRRITLTS
jgi:hypothetical protein